MDPSMVKAKTEAYRVLVFIYALSTTFDFWHNKICEKWHERIASLFCFFFELSNFILL